MADYKLVTRKEVEEVLSAERGWRKSAVKAGEYVYDWPVKRWPGVVIRVYTSVDKETDTSRGVGRDAIRVCVVDIPNSRGVLKARRVHRTLNWRTNLRKRVEGMLRHVDDVMSKRESRGEWSAPAAPASEAAAAFPRKCGQCHGTGRYVRPTEQGGFVDLGNCYACAGKGFQTEEDAHRNASYWSHRAAAAIQADLHLYGREPGSDDDREDGCLDPEDIPLVDDMDFTPDEVARAANGVELDEWN